MNSVDNSPLSSPTTGAVAAPLPTSTNWCRVCDRSIVLLVSSPNLTCPHCGTDRIEQREPHPHHLLPPRPLPTSLLLPFDDFEDDDEELSFSYFVVHHPPRAPPPALLLSSSSAIDDDFDYDGSDLHLVDDEDRDGRPSPAPKSSIDAIPEVVITADFLGSDGDSCVLCVVCREELAIGLEAKLLPCSHVYHGDCISPWLSQTNSCPVCRYRLPIAGEDLGRMRPGGVRSRVPVVSLGNSLEEEGGLDGLARVPAASNRTWIPMLSQSAAANDREAALSAWVTETEGSVAIGGGMDNDGEVLRPVALVE